MFLGLGGEGEGGLLVVRVFLGVEGVASGREVVGIMVFRGVGKSDLGKRLKSYSAMVSKNFKGG